MTQEEYLQAQIDALTNGLKKLCYAIAQSGSLVTASSKAVATWEQTQAELFNLKTDYTNGTGI